MTGIGSPKGESKPSPGTEEHGARTAARARAAAVPPAMEQRPDGGAGEWLQQFAWSVEDNNFEWAAYYLKWLQSEGGWAASQALELAQERLVQAPDGKGSAASLVRLYHCLGPMVPRAHTFHESFLVRLEQRMGAMPPSAAAHTVVLAIERALELFRAGLSTHPAFERLGLTLTALREASEKVIQQERERELENLIAGKEFNRAIELARHLVEKYQSPLASGLLPSLLSRVGPRSVPLETIEGGAARRMREWDWPEGADETDDPRQARPSHLRMVRSDDEIQLPNKAWSRAFEAPPLPISGKTERSSLDAHLSRGPRRDDPVSLPDPSQYQEDASGQEGEPSSERLGTRGEMSAAAPSAAAVETSPGTSASAAEVNTPRTTQPGGATARTTQPGGTIRSTQPGVVMAPSTRPSDATETASPGPAEAIRPATLPTGVTPDASPSMDNPVLSSSEAASAVEGERPLLRRRPVLLGIFILLAVVVYGVFQFLPPRTGPNVEPQVPTPSAQAPAQDGGTVASPVVEPAFKAPSGPPSLLTLEVIPDDKLELYLNGIIYPDGKITGLTVPAGKHLIEIYRQGYEPFRQEIRPLRPTRPECR